ncbi:hypothetical protein C8R46DRAFT_1190647 [Mycena filopes]|nr:hypothetical protein C8R46DRAFT_1190647 [Mycena filopes]
MATRAQYLYHPLGGKPTSPSPWRDLLCNPVRCTAILLIVALSVTSVGFIVVQRPWGSSVVAPNKLHPPHELDEPPIPIPTIPIPIPPTKPQPPLFVELEPVPEVIAATVYDPFLAPSPENAIADPMVRPIKAHRALSEECMDTWVSTGLWQEPCRHSMVGDSQIDLVYVWVNGSDALHQKARKELLEATGYKTKDARFREHDELRYSLRSVRNATATWPNSTWHIITADVPVPAEPSPNINLNNTAPHDDSRRRLGLVPQWLDIECAFHGSPDGHGQPPIRLQHDSQLFRFTGPPGVALKPADASRWLGKILPSFNSHAVESQLPQLDPRVVSDNIVALNDDQFMMLPHPPSAFHTTLYGPVFRMDPNLLVAGDASGSADGGGEWRSLGWSASLLSNYYFNHTLHDRFGTRKRPYIHHNARALSLPLMHELSLAFGPSFAATPLSQFRGSHKVAGELEVNTIFMATHFVIERHREALLYAWVVAKWGSAGSEEGVLDRDVKWKMWVELGGGEADGLGWRGEAGRTTGEDVEANLLMAGVEPPRSFDEERQADVAYSWVSMDGFSANFHTLSKQVDMEMSECLFEEAELAWDVFRRLLVEKPTCGDRTIAALMYASKSGLGVFLPPPSPTSPPSATHLNPLTLPLDLPLRAPPLPPNPRAFAVSLLLRYAHVLGDSVTIFAPLKSAAQAARALRDADKQRNLALMCLNDDLGNGDGEQRGAEEVLRGWFEGRWHERLECER